MLDPIIHKHLDEIDKIEDSVDKDISDILSSLDIKAVIENPNEAMLSIARIIEDLIIEDYLKRTVELGIAFSREIDKAKNIAVSDSSNPNLNKEIIE
jgi:hypothetical protein